MAKPQKKTAELEDIELHHDAWKRFEDFVDTKVCIAAAPSKRTPSRAKATSRKASKSA
jgi:hypothetical protein